MTRGDLVRYLVEVVETLGAEHMIGGSQAQTGNEIRRRT
jgi:hypothetical protein